MKKAFKHPLARNATTVKARQRDGVDHEMLLIVTTLELEAAAKGFNARNVDRLHDAAKAFLDDVQDIAGYVIVNRPKEWAR